MTEKPKFRAEMNKSGRWFVAITMGDGPDYRNSAAFKDLLPMREKVAKWRTFVVEGVPQ